MVMQLCWGEPLAQRAVLEHEIDLLNDISKTAEPLLRMVNEWQLDPVELAHYLKSEDALKVMESDQKTDFRVLLKGKNEFKSLSRKELEKAFSFTYWPHLYFKKYSDLKSTIRNCPHLLRNSERLLKLGFQYQNQIKQGFSIESSIRWTDENHGYGLFAEENLDKGVYVGEYTGEVRALSRLFPDHNAYCFHYPTRFWSWNYTMIDSKNVGNEMRFINHSDTPNLEPLCLIDRRLIHLGFKTKAPIRKGTQLTFDYGPDYWKQRKKHSH